MCVCLRQLAELVQCNITEVTVDDHHSSSQCFGSLIEECRYCADWKGQRMLILGTIASEFMQMNVFVHRWRDVFT